VEVCHARCAGLDVHKATVVACALLSEGGGPVQRETKTFATHTRALMELADWLAERGVTHVAMEATGVYWKPVWAVLEGQFELLLANAQHMRNIPGRKTDVNDAAWIADLLRHGLLKGSFVPPQPIQDLRDLMRYRSQLTRERAAVTNRIAKLLEQANIKLGDVASDIMGRSGQDMLQALAEGQQDPARLASYGRRQLRDKRAELELALTGKVREHHRYLLGKLLEHWRFLSRQIQELEQDVERQMAPFAEAVSRLESIPGVSRVTAWTIVAEMGVSMQRFATAHHLASWAGVCPGQHESAGKRYSGRIRPGNLWLRSALCEAAWGATRKKGCYFGALYRRLAGRRGKRRALVAVAHALLVVAYYVLRDRRSYAELGGDYFDRLHAESIKRYHIRRLQQLGLKVSVEAAA
jgi:transposase